jgi:hypothetical protein
MVMFITLTTVPHIQHKGTFGLPQSFMQFAANFVHSRLGALL